MSATEELKLILTLIRKHSLPISPILEYAINEKIEKFQEETPEEKKNVKNSHVGSTINVAEKKSQVSSSVNDDDDINVVVYTSHSFAVIGNTKPHKDALKLMGGRFAPKTLYGAAWVFYNDKKKNVLAYIERQYPHKKIYSQDSSLIGKARFFIKVDFPDGRSSCHNLVYLTLIDVIKYAGPYKVRSLNILCKNENLVSPDLHKVLTYRSGQKEIGNGLYVSTFSTTEEKFNQICEINTRLNLGLKITKVRNDKY